LAIRFDDIGNRLKAFRLASGLSADQIAKRLDISRAALYRFEKGELAKIETLDKLAELLGVSVPTLLGVGVEYLPSAVAYFERLRQLEETASHIIVLAGPISYLLSSDAFHDRLAQVLSESIPDKVENRKRALADVERIMAILRERKSQYRARRPAIVNLIAASEIDHFIGAIEQHPIGVQIGIVPDTLPQTGFQIFRQPDREVLTLSPFRLGEHPNVRVGVAMLTSAPEALALHHKAAEEMWQRAHKGAAAANLLRRILRGV